MSGKRKKGAYWMKEAYSSAYQEVITHQVKEIIAEALSISSHELETEKSFLELGINSLLAVDLIENINQKLGTELGFEVIFDTTGIRDLVEYITSQYKLEDLHQDHIDLPSTIASPPLSAEIYRLEKTREEVMEEEGATTFTPFSSRERTSDIAIVGISGKFANAETIEAFWDHLQAGDCCFGEIQREGWEESRYYDADPGKKNRSISKWGGLLDAVDAFDADFFGISPSEAERMDPQQRLLLEEAFKAIEDSGHALEQLSEKRVGVFIGGRPSGYKEKYLDGELSVQTFLGNETSILAARLSYFFNWKGPSLTVDTACSSSLVAIHLACESVRRGEVELALAGGVFVMNSPDFLIMSSKAGLLSPDGTCHTFDASANGMVLGEGVGVAILKRLDDALNDRDHIYGVIKGSAVNQAGKTNGLTAPSVLSQKELLIEAYKNASLPVETISYIEAHGTGTSLGDAIEVKALSEVFRLYTDKVQFCALGSHKPNFGHSAVTAGIAGLFKVLMAMKHRKIPPTIGVKKVNGHIDLNGSPFFLNTEMLDWESRAGFPLRAGISSFGSSGTNCHMIIEEPPLQERNSEYQASPDYFFPFSAKTKLALRQRMVDMVRWLENQAEGHSASEISYNLTTGKSHFPVRGVIIARNLVELKETLISIQQNKKAENYYESEEHKHVLVEPLLLTYGKQIIEEFAGHKDIPVETYREKLLVLASLYVKGYELAWGHLYKERAYSRISLPTYSFARNHYWISEAAEQPLETLKAKGVTPNGGLQVRELDELLCKLLWVQLQSIGLLPDKVSTRESLLASLHAPYDRWLEESIRFLARAGYLEYDGKVCSLREEIRLDGASVWREWEIQRKIWLEDADKRSQVVLAETMLRAIPDILTGKKRATDSMFPHSSLALVEGIFKNNVVSDYFNETLADTLLANLQARLKQDPSAKVRLLELGAGTGGTSAVLFQKLKPYQDHVQEYCYTDISKAFLTHAQKEYASDNPYLSYQLLNIEAPLDKQLIEGEKYDILIAANVLHATRNIQQTLRNVKALLKKDGLLLLNEISYNSCFLHVTFGLLEGWWLYEDAEMRIPGCPALAPEVWRSLLEEEGFRSVAFPAQKGHEVGQQIIVAGSDGLLRETQLPLKENGESRTSGSTVREAKLLQPRVSQAESELAGQTLNDYVKQTLREKISRALDVEVDLIDVDVSFRDFGVDSIIGVNLVQEINEIFSIELETTVLFDYSSVEQLTTHILSEYEGQIGVAFGQQQKREPASQAPAFPEKVVHRWEESNLANSGACKTSRTSEPVAIVGMSGRFAACKTVDELWEKISKGANLVEEVARWDLSAYYSGQEKFCKHGALLDDIDQFDPLFFNISGLEATYMDPQQRLVLEESWKALEDAGYAAGVQGSLCGVYVGCEKGDYQQLIEDNPPPQAFWGNLGSLIPARIAYHLDLQGPAIAVDTACSSSLVAIHLACQGLWSRETDMALAGGVFIQSTPGFYISANRAEMLSPTGSCYAFDDRADGMVPGEAVGMVVLKRLSDAVADGDYIYGIIKGSGINQDGTTNGITAPSLKSQERLERFVYDTFQIDPEEIQLVEAHGTGTKLGDPIEFQALTRTFRHYTRKSSYCAIGSIKANLGHTQIASGVTGLMKILLSLKHKQILPSLHFETSNANIQLESSPFYVNTSLKDWNVESGRKRLAALSSFGASGTNAHMVVEEAPQIERQHVDRPGYLIVLSARSSAQLRQQAEQLVTFCQQGSHVDCGNMSYTLLVGRRHFRHRLACVVCNQEELIHSLTAWLENRQSEKIFVAETHENERREDPTRKNYGNQCIQDCQHVRSAETYLEQLTIIADLYTLGYRLAFEHLFAGGQYTRVPLPTYPFARERYWIPLKEGSALRREVAAFPAIQEAIPANPSLSRVSEAFETMTFEEVWQEQPLPGLAGAKPDLLVCFLTKPENQQAVSAALRRLSPRTKVIFIAQHASVEQNALQTYDISRTDSNSYRLIFQGIREMHGNVDAVLYLWPLEDPGCIQDYTCPLYLVQSLAATNVRPKKLLWAGSFASGLERCYLESWIGFERSLGALLPHIQLAGVYAEANEQNQTTLLDTWVQRLWTELQTPKAQSVFYRGNQRFVYQVRPTTLQPGQSLLKRGGTYLITGGCGGLGLLLAEYVARKYQANLILVGRSPLDAEKQAKVKKLEQLGSQVIYVQGDVCDSVALNAGLSKARQRFGSINGAIHAAGIFSALPLLEKDPQQFQEVLRPKIQGTLVLDKILAQEKLDFSCYFSSLAAILGDFGSCDYAIANRFLMAYGLYRNELQQQGLRHGKTVVINWPVWREGSMLVDDDENARMYLKASGQRFLESEEGLELFERFLAQSHTQHLVLVGQSGRVRRFLGLSSEHAERSTSPHSNSSKDRRRPEMSGLTVSQCLEWDLKGMMSELLQIDPIKLDRATNLADFGFDSLSLAKFASMLTDRLGIEVTPTLFYGHSTLSKLTQYYLSGHAEAMQELYRNFTPPARLDAPAQTAMVASIAPQQSARKVRAISSPAPHHIAQSREPIAIIGMSGRFPRARTLDELWATLAEGQEVIEKHPVDRFRDGDTEPGRWKGGWMPGVREFDPSFFEISPREAESMDPRQRLLLQESWRALEDAGYGPKQIENSKIGMFVGAEQGDFQTLLKERSSITANSNAILAARLAYFLNLSGPVMAIDTACSSGLVALHQACQSISNGECDTAIAAGVSLILAPETLLRMEQAGMLSEDGRCSAFGEQANGMVPAEAVAVVVLKRLSQAIADADPIYAVIKGSGINYDGKTNGITAPSEIAQAQLLKSIYDNYQVNPEEIDYIVTHGTGTRQGDPVEISALQSAFKAYTTKQGFCAITSVKSNIGHTLAASGLVSLMSLVQALHHETIPASIHAEEENTYIQWKESPFFINKTAKSWPQKNGQSRVGAVSSFGMSGTNSHVVVESYVPEQVSTGEVQSPYYLLAFSAKTREALQEKVEEMIAFLRSERAQKGELLQMSYTLLRGRQHFLHRCAVVVQDLEETIRVLQQALHMDRWPTLFQGTVSRDFTAQKALELFAQDLLKQSQSVRENGQKYQEILLALADLYCQGYELDWERLFVGTGTKRVHLPAYPFAREQYWVREEEYRTIGSEQKMPQLQSTETALPQISLHAGKISLRTLTDEPVQPMQADLPIQKPVVLSLNGSAEQNEQHEAAFPISSPVVVQIEELQEELAAGLADVLYMKREGIDPERKFVEMGLDSIIGVEWINAINKQYHLSLSATRIYDYPTLREFAAFLAQQIHKEARQVSSSLPQQHSFRAVASRLPEAVLASTAIAVVDVNPQNAPAETLVYESLPVEQRTSLNVDQSMDVKPGHWGNPLFKTRYRCKWNYYAGSMGDGVASVELVSAMGKANLLSIFGCAGLRAEQIEPYIQAIQARLGPRKPYGMCLISNIHYPAEERRQVELFLKYHIPVIEVAAFSSITEPLVYCRIKGLSVQGDRLVIPRRIIAKCSHPGIARHFLTPPPIDLVQNLLQSGLLSEEEARLSQLIPMADDLALEADSGGHTDQGVAFALFPAILALKEEMKRRYRYQEEIMLGCGGGIGTPAAIVSAFALGADFVFTGSINQCTVESGAHEVVKDILSTVGFHDTAITIAGDMFEMGAKAQVVKKNSLFSLRSNQLYQLYQQYHSLDELPASVKRELETSYFKKTFEEVWGLVCQYKSQRNPEQIAEANENPRLKMALIFKWYFAHCGQVTRDGDIAEADNFQIFCGPAMGAFNQWVKGTRYEDWKNRHVHEIAELLMHEACVYAQTKRLLPIEGNVLQKENVSLVDRKSANESAIAIIGISGQFPKAKNLAEFWDNLASGKDCITEIPASRWSVEHYYNPNPETPGKTYCKWIGALDDIDKFDPLFFHITPAEAELMDPQQRLFLENCWSAIEDAGLSISALSGSRCGVFAGCATGDYGKRVSQQELSGQALMGETTSILAARISYLLNLKGPSMAIETACSSSLVAIANACNSLLLHDSDLALAGGVNVLEGPALHIQTSKAGMLSKDGHCYTFDARANGFVPGEGVGVLLLKRLPDAIKDQDTIYGVIRGWGVNQDGKTNGITAPSTNSQRVLLQQEVYERFQINPETITLIEAHGTGTRLGDPIEVEALIDAFQHYTEKKGYCALGSVKSNIGHLLTAAGIAGVLKVVLALKHKMLPPTINFERMNEHISLTDSPFYISTELRPWKERPEGPRRAGVSAFGFSGTNAHLVIEEYIPDAKARSEIL